MLHHYYHGINCTIYAIHSEVRKCIEYGAKLIEEYILKGFSNPNKIDWVAEYKLW